MAYEKIHRAISIFWVFYIPASIILLWGSFIRDCRNEERCSRCEQHETEAKP